MMDDGMGYGWHGMEWKGLEDHWDIMDGLNKYISHAITNGREERKIFFTLAHFDSKRRNLVEAGWDEMDILVPWYICTNMEEKRRILKVAFFFFATFSFARVMKYRFIVKKFRVNSGDFSCGLVNAVFYLRVYKT